MGVFTQIVILLIVLACMVMVLLAIRQLSHFDGFEDSSETTHLKEDMHQKGDVLSHSNIFSTLVEVESEEKKGDYSSKSNDPLSPRE